MKPSSKKVREFLEQAKQNPVDIPWIEHTLSVGDTAALIADALNRRGQNLDPEKLRTLGYLHDIGKLGGNYYFLAHVLDGYVYLKRHNYPDEYCNICLTHSFPTNDPELTLSTPIFDPGHLPSQEHMQSLTDIIPSGDGVEFLRNFIKNHNFTLEERIVSLCDLICLDHPVTLEKRMIDIISRHGAWQNTQKVIIEVMDFKQQLDEMLGQDLYNLWQN